METLLKQGETDNLANSIDDMEEDFINVHVTLFEGTFSTKHELYLFLTFSIQGLSPARENRQHLLLQGDHRKLEEGNVDPVLI